ncbi:lysine decarboxylase-like protein [Penicillium lagena]|uniref:lysine decarboxylase-like protein n=1 Tax=Penicillium lagena TaxID=94218 RepID=UPI00254087EC|nr:lysine decarboxylase-like protein [Penicillium lagena]KAJ5620583.1 lysine decarboxylase-like protein [Penicillium lagena]
MNNRLQSAETSPSSWHLAATPLCKMMQHTSTQFGALPYEFNKRNVQLVYGGGTRGLMGEIAKALVSLAT